MLVETPATQYSDMIKLHVPLSYGKALSAIPAVPFSDNGASVHQSQMSASYYFCRSILLSPSCYIEHEGHTHIYVLSVRSRLRVAYARASPYRLTDLLHVVPPSCFHPTSTLLPRQPTHSSLQVLWRIRTPCQCICKFVEAGSDDVPSLCLCLVPTSIPISINLTRRPPARPLPRAPPSRLWTLE